MTAKKKAEVIKEFFGVEGKPVTNPEMMDFVKQDRAGYNDLAQAAAVALGYEPFK